MNSNADAGQCQYVYIHNIPKAYRACHLRRFFSEFIESSRFVCFHFRHRPSLRLPSDDLSQLPCSTLLSVVRKKERNTSMACAIACLSQEDAILFHKRYHRSHWLSVDSADEGFPLSDQCYIIPITLDSNIEQLEALRKLLEFKPPCWMPAGNVGTTTSHFFSLIKNCRLDSTIITKLKLDFASSKRNRVYGAVPYNYDSLESDSLAILPGEVRTHNGFRILSSEEYNEEEFKPPQVSTTSRQSSCEPEQAKTEDDDIPEPEDEPCEEWERFEALHDDPYKVERRDKANIKYEDKIELVWEKGGPGLVFHTDERTWRKLDPLRKEEFFDEPASFDWDIDMDVYEEKPKQWVPGPSAEGHWGIARDTADLIDIQCSRESLEMPSTSGTGSASTVHRKPHDYAYSFRLMRQMGWKPGMRLGASHGRGLLTPIQPGSLGPRVRHGLGYYGTRADRQCGLGTSKPSVYIRTTYDSDKYAASRSGLDETKGPFCRQDPHDILKYRIRVDASTSGEPSSSTRLDVPKNRTIILIPNQTLSKEGISFIPGGVLYPKQEQ